MIPMSLRWRLPLTYAFIALLAVLALGAVLLITLRGVYRQRELDYLIANADVIAEEIAGPMADNIAPTGWLQAQIAGLAFLTQTRVRVTGPAGATVYADSGDPATTDGSTRIAIDVTVGDVAQSFSQSIEQGESGATSSYSSTIIVEDATFSRNLDEVVTTQGGDAPPASRLPTIGTLFGFGLNPALSSTGERSNLVVRRPILDLAGETLGYVELLDGPAYGRDILRSVARGWAIAGAVAVLLAALVGWAASRRITRPILALTDATRRMAGGDLAVRAEVVGQDEIAVLTESFNRMAGRVEETVDALQRFVADAAHELHTPLTALRSDLELLAASAGDAQGARLARAREQTLRLETLTTGLLALSRLETDAAERARAPLDLGDLLRATSEPYASRAEQAGVRFVLELPAGPLHVIGDARQLGQAIGNLLDNALKFTPPGGAVWVGMRADGAWAALTVADTGIGIPTADAPHVFERFHRGGNAAGYPGSGLGLAMVKAIVEGHGGRVAAEASGSGATLAVRLPLEEAPDAP